MFILKLVRGHVQHVRVLDVYDFLTYLVEATPSKVVRLWWMVVLMCRSIGR